MAQNQQEPESTRRVLHRITPMYPEFAKRANLSGTVKLTAVVAPDGKVRAVEPIGGSPILIRAAEDAIYKWKYAPAGGETREPVELHFNPQ